jgi:hypothetical protein
VLLRVLGWLLLVDLLRGLEQAPLQKERRVLLQGLVQTQVRGLLRCECRARLLVQMQRREQTLYWFDERGLVRGLVIGLERGP